MVSLFYNEADLTIANKYKLLLNKKLGSGAFGEVYQGIDIYNVIIIGINIQNHTKIAIKIEPSKNPHPQLRYESTVMKYLHGGKGIPTCYLFLSFSDKNLMIMDLLGPNLETLLSKFNRHFSLKTILLLGLQMISRILYLHKSHVIHRDIKPDNFLIGTEDNDNVIYLIDFGLAKRFRDPKTGAHIPYKDGKKLTGTARYASIYTHLGIEQSRRDDLESMIYSLIYFYKGVLPWQNIQAKSKHEKYQKILEKKINVGVEELCKEMPSEFVTLVQYVRNLQFEEVPDYEMMKTKLKNVLEREKMTFSWDFDWIAKEDDKDSNEDSSDDSSKENKIIDSSNKNKNETKNENAQNMINNITNLSTN